MPPSPNTCASSRISRGTGTPPTRSATSTRAPVKPDKAIGQYTRDRRQPRPRRLLLPRPPRSIRKSSKSSRTTRRRSCSSASCRRNRGCWPTRSPTSASSATAGGPVGTRLAPTRWSSGSAALDPSDVEGRAAARILEESGETIGAAIRFRELHADLLEKNRRADALAALRDAVRLNPDDREGRAASSRARRSRAEISTPRERSSMPRRPPRDPTLLLALLTIDLRAGALDRSRDLDSAAAGRR